MNGISKQLYRTNLNRIARSLNDWKSKRQHWDRPGRLLIAELTKFEECHAVGYGRNGAGTLVDLRTSLFEVESIQLDRFQNTDLISLYLNVRITVGQSCRSTRVCIQLKDRRDRITEIHLPIRWVTEEEKRDLIGQFQSLFGYKLFGDLTEGVYGKIIDDIYYQEKLSEEFLELLEKTDYRCYRSFEYTHKYSFTPEYITENNHCLEIGWKTNETYNSLPCRIRITRKLGKLNTVKLSDLGIEGRGYYDHTDNFQILPEIQEKAIRFNQEFNRRISK